VRKELSGLEPYAYALLRFVAGLLFTFHGLQKMFGLVGGTAASLVSLHGAAGVIELVGGILMAVGLLTIPVAFISSGTMAYAYFSVHQARGFWPIQNRGELAVLFCFVFLLLSARGSGIWSVDAALRLRSARSRPSYSETSP
jgi:putative oxidoreductase